MAERTATKLSTEPVVPGQVEVLRKLWIEAIDNARPGIKKARRDAENLTPDNALRHDLMAHIDSLKLEVELRRAPYDDAWRRFEAQEGREHDAASDRLAKTNTRLAIAIFVATLVSTGAAIAQAYYAARGAH